MARVTDLQGIKQILLPLEESGNLVKRTQEEVCTCVLACYFDYTYYIYFANLIIIS